MPKPNTQAIIKKCYELLQSWASENKGTKEVNLLQLFDLLRQYDFERYMGHFIEGGKELKQSVMKKDMRSNKTKDLFRNASDNRDEFGRIIYSDFKSETISLDESEVTK